MPSRGGTDGAVKNPARFSPQVFPSPQSAGGHDRRVESPTGSCVVMSNSIFS